MLTAQPLLNVHALSVRRQRRTVLPSGEEQIANGIGRIEMLLWVQPPSTSNQHAARDAEKRYSSKPCRRHVERGTTAVAGRSRDVMPSCPQMVPAKPSEWKRERAPPAADRYCPRAGGVTFDTELSREPVPDMNRDEWAKGTSTALFETQETRRCRSQGRNSRE